MQTIGLQEAAKLLRCNVETVRAKAASGEIPAAKTGRAWVFIEVDLLAWLRAQYNQGEKKCHYTKTKKAHSGSLTSFQTEKELDEALGLPTKKTRKESMTNLKLVSGNKKQQATHGTTP